jgi:dienelactone hydrolase
MHVPVRVPIGQTALEGDLSLPASPLGVVLFAHGSGSSRHSPRNQYVAGVLRERGMATLLIDLLTAEEESVDRVTAQWRFDIGRLASRLTAIVDWLRSQPTTERLPIGLFGASTGGAAALATAADRAAQIAAVVSRGGRPDLAAGALAQVRAPTLLIVGELDRQVLELNQTAMRQMPGLATLEVIPGATHLFEEPGALERVAAMAAEWFTRHFAPTSEWAVAARQANVGGT